MTKEIRLPAPHPALRARLEGGLRRPGHPGTAVRIGEELYEVVAAESSGREWLYRLEPWTDQEVIRAYVEWGEEAERAFVTGLGEARARERKDLLAWAAQAFLGFLPAENQERLSQIRGLDPGRASLWSAVLESLVAFPFVFVFFVSLFAGTNFVGSIPAWIGGLALVALADGLFRLVAVISTGEPIGSLFLILLRLRAAPKGPRYTGEDEIAAIEGALSVISPVPKVWWERAGGVTYGGEAYILAGWDRKGSRHHYRFRKGGAGFPILDPGLEKLRNRSSDLSYVLALLWGFLPPDRQKALAFYGRYRPRPYILISIGFNALVALALIGPGLRDLATGVLKAGNLILFTVALLLFSESALRLLRLLKDGRPTGSCLGLLVQPLYDRTFKDKPSPPP